jgi:hypothetical protein
MMAQAPDTVRRRQGDGHPPDFAAVMMARAMAEVFQDDPGCRMPEPLAALLQQMKRWKMSKHTVQAERKPSATKNLSVRN